tara:strand:+ start:23419 stop:24174 length:756 start_codon:yes stop_codon:yes gene_type:complete
LSLTNKEINLFARHLILEDFTEKKQKILSRSQVTFVGMGGINSPIIIYLSYIGIKNFNIIDYDNVKISNLNRQIIYSQNDIGKKKVLCAKRFLKKINSKLKIRTYNAKIIKKNCNKLLSNSDLIVDGSDNWETMLIVNDYCVKYNVPLLSASVAGYDGNIALFNNIPNKHLCLRCVFPIKKEIELPRCDTVGVFGTSAGVIGILSAHKIANFLTSDKNEQFKSNIVYFNGKNSNFSEIELSYNKNCKLLKL